MNVLDQYEKLSGQQINFSKSAITFGELVAPNSQQAIRDITGIIGEGGNGKYLGLPECFSGSEKQLLSYIKDKISANLFGWYAKKLSQGGKQVLLKSIALAIPIYVMACFKLPVELCRNLSVMMNFWWNDDEFRRKIHWLGWEKLSLPKCLGGIGFKNLQCFNQAMLSFRGHIGPLLDYTQIQVGWDIHFERLNCNKPAMAITKSVVKDLRLSSYVADGASSWFRESLDAERYPYHGVGIQMCA